MHLNAGRDAGHLKATVLERNVAYGWFRELDVTAGWVASPRQEIFLTQRGDELVVWVNQVNVGQFGMRMEANNQTS